MNSIAPEIEQEEAKIAIPGFILAGKILQPGGLLEALAPFEGTDLRLVLSTQEGEELYSIPGLQIEEEGFDPFLYFLQGLDSSLEAGSYGLRLEDALSAEVHGEYQAELLPRNFRREEIPLNKRLTGIRTDTGEQRREEDRRLTELLRSTNIHSRFIRNSPGRVHPVADIFYTSLYGDRRVYLYDDGSSAQSIHNGLDYRAAIGEAIMSPMNGRVVMAENRIVSGKHGCA